MFVTHAIEISVNDTFARLMTTVGYVLSKRTPVYTCINADRIYLLNWHSSLSTSWRTYCKSKEMIDYWDALSKPEVALVSS
jgi:hypothetical protein